MGVIAAAPAGFSSNSAGSKSANTGSRISTCSRGEEYSWSFRMDRVNLIGCPGAMEVPLAVLPARGAIVGLPAALRTTKVVVSLFAARAPASVAAENVAVLTKLYGKEPDVNVESQVAPSAPHTLPAMLADTFACGRISSSQVIRIRQTLLPVPKLFRAVALPLKMPTFSAVVPTTGHAVPPAVFQYSSLPAPLLIEVRLKASGMSSVTTHSVSGKLPVFPQRRV